MMRRSMNQETYPGPDTIEESTGEQTTTEDEEELNGSNPGNVGRVLVTELVALVVGFIDTVRDQYIFDLQPSSVRE